MNETPTLAEPPARLDGDEAASGAVPRRRVAVVGGGIAGLTAAYRLRNRCSVDLFEASPRVGGHTHTLDIEGPDGLARAIDLGFIVFNHRTYPRFRALLSDLEVPCQESEMSFSVRSERQDLEWNGSSLGQIFAQRRNLLRPRIWRMIAGILRFHRRGAALREEPAHVTLGDVIERDAYSRPFVELYLLPMLAAIWSTDPSRVRDFPVRTLAAFLENHGMLTVDDRPPWRVVQGGSSAYVDALLQTFEEGRRGDLGVRVHTDSPVERIRRRVGSAGASGKEPGSWTPAVELRVEGTWRAFDAVIVAAHADSALALLDDATAAESEVLGAFPYVSNDVTLHTDASLMPQRRDVWASWNYHLDPAEASEATRRGAGDTRVTYWMNRLQGLEEAPVDYFVSLNRDEAIDPARVLHRIRMAHPQFGVASEGAKARWDEISGHRTLYCGAYWGFGFHEDGVVSGERAARRALVALGMEVVT